MLPLSLVKTAQGQPVLVELKSGETYNGHLMACDAWMNLELKEVICTSKDGDKFLRLPQVYIKGATVKYIRVPDQVLEKVRQENFKRQDRRQQGPSGGYRGQGRGRQGGRGDYGGRGDFAGRGRRGGDRGRGRSNRGRVN